MLSRFPIQNAQPNQQSNGLLNDDTLGLLRDYGLPIGMALLSRATDSEGKQPGNVFSDIGGIIPQVQKSRLARQQLADEASNRALQRQIQLANLGISQERLGVEKGRFGLEQQKGIQEQAATQQLSELFGDTGATDQIKKQKASSAVTSLLKAGKTDQALKLARTYNLLPENENPVFGSGVDNNQIRALTKFVKQDNPGLTDQEAFDAAGNILNGETNLGDKPLKVGGITKHLAERMVKSETDVQARNQQRYALTLDQLLDEGNQILPGISKFAGTIGKGKSLNDALKSQFGEQSKEYSDYLYFTRQLIPQAAGEMLRTLGANATDTQKKMYLQVVNPLSWDTNPQIAIRNYEMLTNSLKNRIGKTISLNPSEIRNQLRNKSGETLNNRADSLGNEGFQVNRNPENIKAWEQQARDAIASGKNPSVVNQKLRELRGY